MKKLEYIYIASPYTKGDVAVNVRRSLDAYDLLIRNCFFPFSPLFSHFAHMLNPHPYDDWMALDFAWIKRCDALVRLSGESAGADREVDEALRRNIPVFYGIDSLINYIEERRMEVVKDA